MKIENEQLLTEEIKQEMKFNKTDDFLLGDYLYMGMGLIGSHRVCISVAYKINYCIKKALQFTEADSNVKFTHINKVKVGDLEACKRFDIQNLV